MAMEQAVMMARAHCVVTGRHVVTDGTTSGRAKQRVVVRHVTRDAAYCCAG
jgi:hypothetical protein